MNKAKPYKAGVLPAFEGGAQPVWTMGSPGFGRSGLLHFLLCVLFLVSTVDLRAQFGKNKVQYQSFNWKFISTPHFDVYYDQPLKYVAEYCAHTAEGAFEGLCADLNYRVNKRISIFVYGSHVQYQQTNVIAEFMPEGIRGVTELYKNRVVVNFEGNWEHFRQLIHHELTHAVLNEMLYYGTTRYFMVSKVQLPLWMNEGLAEFESLKGMDAATDMFMRDITLSESLPPLEELGGYFAYRGGQAFWDYVVRRYGRGKIADILSGVRLGLDLNAVFVNSFSMTFEEFSEMWLGDMKKQYFPDLATYTRVEEFARRLSDHTKDASQYNSSPAISPDGSKVAFISLRDGNYAVYLLELEKKDRLRKLVSSQRSLDFEELNVWTPGISWSPKGDKLAISAKAGGEDAIFIVDTKSGDYTKHVFGLNAISSVAWSPDGQYIAFSATSLAQSDIYVMSLKNKSLRRVTNDVFSDEQPAWSPDSQSMYFVSDRGDELSGDLSTGRVLMWRHDVAQSDIYALSLQDASIRRVSNEPSHRKSSPVVSHDGQTLLYVSEENGIGNVYALHLGDGSRDVITNSLSGIGQISLSKDDSKLVFSAANGGSLDLFVLKKPLDAKQFSSTLIPTEVQKRANARVAFSRSTLPLDDQSTDRRMIGYGTVLVETKRSYAETDEDTVQSARRSSNAARRDTLTDHFEEQDYRVSFSNDFVTGGVGYNSLWNNGQGNIDMGFSDILGDHVIYTSFNLWTDLKNSNLAFSYLYQPKVVDYSINAYHNAFLGAFTDPVYGDALYSMSTYGVNVEAQYAWSRFERVEAGLGWVGVRKFNESYPELAATNALMDFAVPHVRYVYDNSQWGFFAPFRGLRAFADIKVSPFTKSFSLLNVDIRQYVPLWREYYGFAFRAAGGLSAGTDAHNFFLGGVENWIGRGSFGVGYDLFSRAEDYAFMQLQTPLRGFEIGQLAGTKYAMANVEFRFPFFSGFVIVPLPVVLLGTAFIDVGTAWNSSLSEIALRRPLDTLDFTGYRRYYSPGSVLLSMGFGLRTVLLGLPLKFDMAWRRDGDIWSEVNYIVSLGYDI